MGRRGRSRRTGLEAGGATGGTTGPSGGRRRRRCVGRRPCPVWRRGPATPAAAARAAVASRAGHLPGVAAGPARRRCPDRAVAPRRWPPSTAADPPWWSATAPAPSGPSTSPMVGPRWLARPHRRGPHRLDPLGGPDRPAVATTSTSGPVTPPTPGWAATSPSTAPGQQIWGANATDPNGNYGVQASMAVGIHGRGDRRHRTVAGAGPVRPQRRQRGGAPGLALLHRRQRLRHPVARRSVRQRADRDREGGDSSPGVAYGQTYTAGGHLRMLGTGGNLLCDHDTNQTIDSSTGGGQLPRRRRHRHRHRHRVLLSGHLGLQPADRARPWTAASPGRPTWVATPPRSPALGDTEGNGNISGGGGGRHRLRRPGLGAQRHQRHRTARLAPGHPGPDHRRCGDRRPHRWRLQRRPGAHHRRPRDLRRTERPAGGDAGERHGGAPELARWSPSTPTGASGSPSPATTPPTPASSSTTRSPGRPATAWAIARGRCSTRTRS